MKHILIILIVITLSGCTKPTPTPTYLVPGEAQVGDIIFTLATETPAPPATCAYGIQAWVRYPVIPIGQDQEIGAAVDLCGSVIEGERVVICIADDCQLTITGQDGQAWAEFEQNLPIGVIPYSVCPESAGFCLEASFLVVEDGE